MEKKKLTKKEQRELNRQLFDAVERYDLSAVKIAVEAGANVNAKDKFGTPILQTAIDKDTKITEYLLEAGADPDIQNNYGKTALHKATSKNDVNKVNLLLRYNADMYIKNNEERTPFDLSLLCGYYNIAELFISAGYIPSKEDMQKIKNNRLFEAVKENDLSAVKAVMADGADANAKDNNGDPLLLYVKFPDAKIMRYLLENGMNPNMKDDSEWSLLHSMSCEGNIDTVKLLLEYGADMTLKDNYGETPFSIALYWKRNDIAELFVFNGYVPAYEDFHFIKDNTERDSLKTRFMALAAQVQEHKESLREETKATSQEFSYADEIIEI